MILIFLCITGFVNILADSQISDTIIMMDATVTDPMECQCQKSVIKYVTKYLAKQSNDSRFGLIAYADMVNLFYRLTWKFNIHRWHKVVDEVMCTGVPTGAEVRLDLAFLLATRMLTNSARNDSPKSVFMEISRIPHSFGKAKNLVTNLGATVEAGVIISTFPLANLNNLPVDTAEPFDTYCAQFYTMRARFPQ